MELRHLRYYVAVAEELHFVRAAERLHIEQSPLSRAIKDLEFSLGVQLLERTTRSTRMTWAGQVFLDEARRVLAAVEQAKVAAKAAASGYHGHLRIGLSDGIAQPRFAALLSQCREDEPDIEIRIFEMSFAQQVKGLQSDQLDAGFALASDVPDGLIAEAVWDDPIAVVIPLRHPLVDYKKITVCDALRHSLILCNPETSSGCHEKVFGILKAADAQPQVGGQASTLGVMLTMVGAGYGIGFAVASQVSMMNRPDVVVRPLAGRCMSFKTYLIRPQVPPSDEMKRFIDRVQPSAEIAMEGSTA